MAFTERAVSHPPLEGEGRPLERSEAVGVG
jgi:hypothetical protein